jgi:N-acetyltransferase
VSRFVEPVTLAGANWVRMEPLSTRHIPEIEAAAHDSDNGSLWFTSAPTPAAAESWVNRMLDMQAGDEGVTFVVRRLADGIVVGSTSMFAVDAPNRRLEIGHTWYSRPARRTGVNTEAKLLLLSHAFEALDCIAVEFRTHFFNSASRAAIERLGAKLDGILRSHQLSPDGCRRDTAVYSILDIEWPAVRANLRHRLARHEPA